MNISSKTRSRLVHAGVALWLALTVVMSYDYLQLKQETMNQKVAIKTWVAVASGYMREYAKCVRYVEIMHETGKCEK